MLCDHFGQVKLVFRFFRMVIKVYTGGNLIHTAHVMGKYFLNLVITETLNDLNIANTLNLSRTTIGE